MPQSLEPSCSTNSDDGPITVNHLRLVSGTQFPAFQVRKRPDFILILDLFSPHMGQIDSCHFSDRHQVAFQVVC